MFRNLIFDWSGTLADDLALVLDATNTVFRHYGLDELDRGEFKAQFRLPYPEFYAEVLPEIELDELEDIFRDGFKISDKKVTLLPYAKEFMEYCQDRHIRCFALTSVDKKAFREQSSELGMDSYFECIYSGVHDKKKVIRELIDRHRLRTDETAFIGDMTHDVETANSAGITSIAVLTGYQNAQQLSQATPDMITPDLRTLRHLLDKKAMREAQRDILRQKADALRINGLRLSTFIGVPSEERGEPQTLKAWITLYPKTPLHGLEDDFSRTIDYAAVATRLEEAALARPRLLIETLAEDMGRLILQEYPVQQVHIRLEKFILPQTDSVAVEMTLNAE